VWLDEELDGHAVRELLVPVASEAISIRPASPVVNSARHEGRECLAVH
jgi:putative SOS response-associated peptidase YedK